jgi:hypothetical protein
MKGAGSEMDCENLEMEVEVSEMDARPSEMKGEALEKVSHLVVRSQRMTCLYDSVSCL